MPRIKFEPVNMICEAQVGESILDVALNNDVPLQHACGGFCSCTTCHVHVKEGKDLLTPMEEDEEDRIQMVDRLTERSRLGCQARLASDSGDIIVEIMNEE